MMDEVRAIIRGVANERGIPPHLMMAHCRKPYLVLARREVMRRLWATGRSMSQIARVMGRDHSTVWYALHKQSVPRRLPWHKPRVRVVRGKLLEMYYAWPIQDLSLLVFWSRRRRRFVGRDGTNVRIGTAVSRHDGPHGSEHRDYPPR